ncbi:hypothetical protein ACH4TV_48040 [Streptomyces sp. NPDC020898]|uniref:HNH endonuclease n=1 Tax=Streptomyces sp. NPDC020898 TaxID=3365101 RepID=UPI00379F5C6A
MVLRRRRSRGSPHPGRCRAGDPREICGATGDVQVHHICALADLAHAGRPASDWPRVMLDRRRKAVVACVRHLSWRIHQAQAARSFTPCARESPMTEKPSWPVRREAAPNRTCCGRHLAAQPPQLPHCMASAVYGSEGSEATTSTRLSSDSPFA